MTTKHPRYTYQVGRFNALAKMGMATSEDFAALVESDEANRAVTAEPEPLPYEEKPVHWGGGASLEGGDVGTRQEAMGLPSNGAV